MAFAYRIAAVVFGIVMAGAAAMAEVTARYHDSDDTPWGDPATRPTLEQTDITAAYIKAVPKTLRFDGADFPEMVGKTEGMALLGDGALALINDDDFGITGSRTQIVVLRGTGIARR